MASPVVDADAHINEDVTAWRSLHEKYPGWVQAGTSGGRLVAQIDGKLYPAQEGPGCGVPIDSATNPAAKAGAARRKATKVRRMGRLLAVG